ncbi:MAG: endonuclease domain-containing protein [Oscillospiraceae bacterium]|nr:endonuclease domain-containing protein [Oscillospiraceae bacterium]MBQ4643148.1 endonuclease domain-containing protein [Oscillospiraceae bacterium]
MERKHNKMLSENAKLLRNNMTKEEKHLWYDYLKNCPVRFSRQKVLGRYIADFYSAKAKLVIELDGVQHYESENRIYDEKRTDFLEQYGLKLIRIPNSEINTNFEGICRYLDKQIEQSLSQLR